MVRKELFEKTRNILIDAYFNDTLIAGKCHACAVGNIIAANIGQQVKIAEDYTGKKHPYWYGKGHREPHWNKVFVTSKTVLSILGFNFGSTHEQRLKLDNFRYEAKHQIESTGYELDELMKIEYAFEVNQKGKTPDEKMFNGLCAVLDVLSEIHECDSSDVKPAKEELKKIHINRKQKTCKT